MKTAEDCGFGIGERTRGLKFSTRFRYRKKNELQDMNSMISDNNGLLVVGQQGTEHTESLTVSRPQNVFLTGGTWASR